MLKEVCRVNSSVSLMTLLGLGLSVSANAAQLECQQSYKLSIKTQTQFEFQGRNITRHQFDSYLSVRPLLGSSVEIPGAVWWGVQMTEVTQSGNGEQLPHDHTLSLPFAVLRAADGQLIDFSFPAKLTEEQQDKLKGLAYYFQFSSELPATSFSRKERDSIGQYSVQYEAESNAQGQFVAKSKSNYLNLSEVKHTQKTENALEAIDVVESQQLIVPSDCWFDSSRGKEVLFIKGVGDGYQMTTDQKHTVLRTVKPVDSLLWQLPEDVDAWLIKEEETKLSQAELVKLRLQFQQALKEMDLLELRGSELAQWLKNFDQVIDVLAEMFEQNVFSDAENMRLLNALGHLDSANGNQLLMGLMSNPQLSETDRFRAMRAITTGTSPLTPELTEQMLSLLANENFEGSESLRGAAIMALGAVVQRRENNEESELLLTELTNKLSAYSDVNEKAALVASLGNTGREDILEDVTRFAQDDSPRVRANVATSLGQLGNEDAHKALSGMLHQESDQRAQQAILSAMGQFQMSDADMEQVTKIATNSSSERTRGRAIQAIGQQTHQPALATRQLKKLMKSEKSRKNFTLAAKALTELRNQTSTPKG